MQLQVEIEFMKIYLLFCSANGNNDLLTFSSRISSSSYYSTSSPVTPTTSSSTISSAPKSTEPKIDSTTKAASMKPVATVVKVKPKSMKTTDYEATYTANNFITAIRAMHEYL
ncbi:unnamed protein product, partial [Didymodactylos carnosus]